MIDDFTTELVLLRAAADARAAGDTARTAQAVADLTRFQDASAERAELLRLADVGRRAERQQVQPQATGSRWDDSPEEELAKTKRRNAELVEQNARLRAAVGGQATKKS